METKSKVNNEEIEILAKSVKIYPDFPRPGIQFCDIFSLLNDSKYSQLLYKNSIAKIEEYIASSKKEFNVVAGLESRGFLLGTIIAERFGVGFIPIRKQSKKNSKLPGNLFSVTYTTEYSEDAFDIQANSISKDTKALLVDDLIATGGSLEASEKLISMGGGEVTVTFCVFEVGFLKGKEKLKDPSSVISLINL